MHITILTQLDLNGDKHPVAFLSQTFTDTERQYKIDDQELLGIIWALKKWRHYLQGSGHMTTVFSDHKNLTYFRTAQKLNDRQARWSLYLSKFDIKLIHLFGTQMVQSDTLPQRPHYGIDESIGREEQTLLPDNMFINFLDIDLQEWILNSSDKMTDIKSTLETIMKEGSMNLQNDLANWKIEDVDGKKTIFYKGKNYIPNNQEL